MPQRLAAVRTAVRPATAPAGGARRPAEPRTAVRTAASLYGLSPMSFWRKCRGLR